MSVPRQANWPSNGWLLAASWGVALCGCARSLPADPAPNVAKALEIRKTIFTSSEGGEAEETATTATGWATLKGVFRLTGDAPARQRVDISKDVEACTANPDATLSEQLLVDPSTKGIANVIVFARKVSRTHESASTPVSPTIDYDQKSCRFLDHALGLQIGQSLNLLNSDPVGHNTRVNSAIPRNTINALIPAGAATPTVYAPAKAEALPVSVNCSIHPWMQAWLIIREDGYFAVSKPDGSFEIANLPAGEDIEFQAWHERATNGLALDQTELKWNNRGRFTINLAEDEVREIELDVPLTALGY